MDYPKSVPNVGLVDGKFIDENTTTGQVGSLIPCGWGNAVTDEILNVIRDGGLDPAEAEHNQLVRAIRAIVQDEIPEEEIRTTLEAYGITDAYTKNATYSKTQVDDLLKNLSALPVGAMVPFPKGEVPAGFLEVDGSVKSIAAYPDLAAYLGTTFNTGGEGAGNFRLPESRGEFLRGWDHARGVDAGRAIGSYQTDDLKEHKHKFGNTHNATYGLSSTGVIGVNPSASINYDTSSVGGTETRPRNLAVMWCIKAWNAPINQGNIDIAALAALAAQATEINQGTAKVATAAQMLDSANDAVMATPKKLRLGFAASLTLNGYVVFPSWLGGLIFQWGKVPASVADGDYAVPFPLQFPGNIFSLVDTFGYSDAVRINSGTTAQIRNVSTSGFIAIREDIGTATSIPNGFITWFAVGN